MTLCYFIFDLRQMVELEHSIMLTVVVIIQAFTLVC